MRRCGSHLQLSESVVTLLLTWGLLSTHGDQLVDAVCHRPVQPQPKSKAEPSSLLSIFLYYPKLHTGLYVYFIHAFIHVCIYSRVTERIYTASISFLVPFIYTGNELKMSLPFSPMCHVTS